MRREFANFHRRVVGQRLPFDASSRSMSSFCAFIDTYSPAAIDVAPASRPETPAISTGAPSDDAAATPRIRATLDTSPSLIPKIPARMLPP